MSPSDVRRAAKLLELRKELTVQLDPDTRPTIASMAAAKKTVKLLWEDSEDSLHGIGKFPAADLIPVLYAMKDGIESELKSLGVELEQ